MQLRFYTGDLRALGRSPVDHSELDIHSVRVFESRSMVSGYQEIDCIKVDLSKQFVEVDNAADDYLGCWYKLAFISDPTVEPVTTFFISEAVLPEVVSDIVDQVRVWVGDTSSEAPAWSDREIVQMIRLALRQMKGDTHFGRIQEEDVVLIVLLVQEIIALILAHDFAKYYALETPTVKLDKSQISAHYREVGRDKREAYAAISKRLNIDGGGYDDLHIITQMPHPNIVTASKFRKTAGRYTVGDAFGLDHIRRYITLNGEESASP